MAISIETLEKDIKENIEHLEIINSMMELNEELRDFVSKNFTPSPIEHIKFDIENIHPIINISKLEISLILKSIHYAKNDIEKNHTLKKGLLIVFETFETLKKFNKILKEYSQKTNKLKNEFNQINLRIKPFRKLLNDDSRIKNIRDNIVAHINSNFIEYYKQLKKIDIVNDYDLLIRFRFMLNDLDEYLFTCMIFESKNI